jgi:ATP-dependent DNA helicase RecG
MCIRDRVTELKGVGHSLAQRLSRLGVESVQDLLFLLPLRYEDRTKVVPIGTLKPGDRAVVQGEVQLAEVVFRRKRVLLVRLADGTGFLTLRFFHFSGAQQEQLQRGVALRCFGEVRRGPMGLEIVHPEYRRLDRGDAQAVEDVLTPVYPATEGVQQGRLRVLTAMALKEAARHSVRDWLPPDLLADLELPALAQALEYVHRPPPDAPQDLLAAGHHPAQRRLAFEELLAHHLSLRQLRRELQRDPAWPLAGPGALEARLLESLPFELTGAQQRVLGEVRSDLARAHPMLRLVQGDVGSGKTVVAALAALRAVEAGFQAALMAPTELLAEQHWQTF